MLKYQTSKTILITGCNGFIGYNLCSRLFYDNYLIGIDSDTNSSDLKSFRSRSVQIDKFYKCSVLDKESLSKIFTNHKIDLVIHLAAKTGVRNSDKDKNSYFNTNVIGFCNILDVMQDFGVYNCIYASSSSVYGTNENAKETDVLNPKSFYALTKEIDESVASMYNRKFNMNLIGLRFFTVYGPYGREDMSPLIWARSLIKGDNVIVYGNGEVMRDYTYIEDITYAINRIIEKGFSGNGVYNIGSGYTIYIEDFLRILATKLGKTPNIIYKELSNQEADITHADTGLFELAYGKLPHTTVHRGIDEMVKWLKHESE